MGELFLAPPFRENVSLKLLESLFGIPLHYISSDFRQVFPEFVNSKSEKILKMTVISYIEILKNSKVYKGGSINKIPHRMLVKRTRNPIQITKYGTDVLVLTQHFILVDLAKL